MTRDEWLFLLVFVGAYVALSAIIPLIGLSAW
jgi:hypothetical protein